ncbi:hypothetical protein [Botrimarina sp.]|uniref:hypothetical protein n=1 Tax=Botrimarina sp. TaxID=2795802 RepID=UPI0032EC931F
MVPRLWITTEAELHAYADSAPFRNVLKGMPPVDRLAVVRLAVETWRRQRITGVRKASLAKCIGDASRAYHQWRRERPDDYQAWRDRQHGGPLHTTPTGSGDVEENPEPTGDEFDGCRC